MAYWIISLALVGIGFLGALSIGMPFLMLGGAMLMLGQFRHRAAVFWPPLFAVVAFNVAYWATAPLSCTATEAIGASITSTCSSPLGGTVITTNSSAPSLTAATDAGLLAATAAFFIVLAVILGRRKRQSSGTGTPSTLNPPST